MSDHGCGSGNQLETVARTHLNLCAERWFLNLSCSNNNCITEWKDKNLNTHYLFRYVIPPLLLIQSRLFLFVYVLQFLVIFPDSFNAICLNLTWEFNRSSIKTGFFCPSFEASINQGQRLQIIKAVIMFWVFVVNSPDACWGRFMPTFFFFFSPTSSCLYKVCRRNSASV